MKTSVQNRFSWQNTNHYLLSLILAGLALIIGLFEQSNSLISNFLPFVLIVLSLFMINTHGRNGVEVDQPVQSQIARSAYAAMLVAAVAALLLKLF